MRICLHKLFATLFLSMLLQTASAQQQILLLVENFEDQMHGFMFDSLGPSGASSGGPNTWVMNDSYDGGGVYVNTPPQDSIVSGTITNYPHSTYLHIHDSINPSGVDNCNWNPAVASDRSAYVGSGFCTLGLEDVEYTFFWLCNGDGQTAWGEVYYSIDGGPWIQTGQPKYFGQNKWKYETVSEPAFENVANLRLAFRWINTASATSDVAFGVDDIIAVGTYNDISNPAEISLDQVTPTSLCQGGFITIFYSLNHPMCTGTYLIESSDANGNFPGPYPDYVINIGAGQVNGVVGIPVPGNLQTNCFKVRIVRTNPLPVVISEESVCITIVDCPETIFNTNAVIMTDIDTACVLSVIDVKFNSIGVFMNNNVYTAQLSDSTGSFMTPFILGTLPSNDSFPAIPPGNISGLIPQNVPEGCNYYIRVVSSNPNVVGDTIGPFCIVQCDLLTNNHTDIHFCINELLGDTEVIVYDVHYWDQNADYSPPNQFIVELRDMQFFSLVNIGGLGAIFDTASGTMTIYVPSADTLAMLGIAPGAYYMRVNPTNSTLPWDETGSLIRIVIGAPSAYPPVILVDTAFCVATVVPFYILHDPIVTMPHYQWNIIPFSNGQWFDWPFNPLYFDFTNVNPDDYTFYVREVDKGCVGPNSAPAKVYVLGIPAVDIAGPVKVCIGDTVTYRVSYRPETYYTWNVTNGRVLDQANSEVTIIFDTLGTCTVTNYSLNECGDSTNTLSVEVVTLFGADINPKQSEVCEGDSVFLRVFSEGVDRVITMQQVHNDSADGFMFNVIAQHDLVIDSISCKFLTTQPITAEVYKRFGSFQGHENIPMDWTNVSGFYIPTPAPLGQMTMLDGYLNIPMTTGDTVGLYVTCIDGHKIADSIVQLPKGSVYKPEGTLDITTGVAVNYVFMAPASGNLTSKVMCARVYYSTKSSLSYYWNTGDTSANIWHTPQADFQYEVLVLDTSGCRNYDTAYVHVKPYPTVDAGTDTLLCKNALYQLDATSTATNFEWTPATGLTATNVLNPTFQYNQTTTYYIMAYDANNCYVYDSVRISVQNCESYIHVPQAFTPNEDGNNDHFTLFQNNILQYELRIFNRWGQMIYNSTDLAETNDLSRGWDGTYKGEKQNAGVYVFYLTATDNNGEKYEQKGDITLIR